MHLFCLVMLVMLNQESAQCNVLSLKGTLTSSFAPCTAQSACSRQTPTVRTLAVAYIVLCFVLPSQCLEMCDNKAVKEKNAQCVSSPCSITMSLLRASVSLFMTWRKTSLPAKAPNNNSPAYSCQNQGNDDMATLGHHELVYTHEHSEHKRRTALEQDSTRPVRILKIGPIPESCSVWGFSRVHKLNHMGNLTDHKSTQT